MHLQNKIPFCIGRAPLGCHVTLSTMAQPFFQSHLRCASHVLPGLSASISTSSSCWNSWPARSVACYASSTQYRSEAAPSGQRPDQKHAGKSSESSTSRPKSGSSRAGSWADRGKQGSWADRGKQTEARPRKRLFGSSEGSDTQGRGPPRSHRKELLETLGLAELQVCVGELLSSVHSTSRLVSCNLCNWLLRLRTWGCNV